MTVSVRPLRTDDRSAWEVLAREYHAFYEEHFSNETYERVWSRLCESKEIHALGAFAGTRLVGIVHYLFHAHVWQQDVCYLQDLFVDGNARGRGAGRALIAHVEHAARERGALRVYWTTKHDNDRARLLYDKVATYSGFIRYDRPV
ncbi:MAG TPA: GNAT family N-acetyltransferase [Gemmatimonadaceae bacterium]|nr:GNAT family N-acetyltransferase [Gemmatimonadaceae bacterium]